MSAIPIFKRILAYGGVLALVLGIVGSVAGYFVAGGIGVVSALIGTVMAVVFLGITTLSVVIATRVAKGDLLSVAFFGIVMGAWLLKFVVFLVLVILLKDQPWVQSTVLFLTLIVAVLGTLIVDVVVIARSRLPYVSDLPSDGTQESASSSTDRPE
ncbi:MAG: hypothetical protein JWN09_2454 [Microbacteriaceae bacterium]|jgi:hypothetical protein|nr:hypothetical protein [Microbacteriaceae bacterium]